MGKEGRDFSEKGLEGQAERLGLYPAGFGSHRS